MRGRGAPTKKAYLYHSNIAKTPEGIKLRFLGDTMDSKFEDSGGLVFAELEDGTEVTFVLENADIRSAVDEVPQKKWVTLKGEGKGDGAWIVIDDDAGPVLPDTPRAPVKATKPQTSPPLDNEWMQLAADAADVASFAYSRMEAHGHPLDSAGKASFLSTVFIAMDKRS